MSVNALGHYQFDSSDALAKYNGKQLVYVFWEKHRMFSRPFVLALPPQTRFSAIIDRHIEECYRYHPDYARIDWSKAVWRNGNEEFTPDRDKTLAENGIGHKDLIRFTTPGLDGIAGSGY